MDTEPGSGTRRGEAGKPRHVALRTGAEQPWDPEDVACAAGQDPTPENVARWRRKLADEGPSIIEKLVP